MAVYEKVDKLRKDRHMSIYELAKKAGVSCAAIYKWRDRKSTPSLYLLESLSYALNVDISALFDAEAAACVKSGVITDADKSFLNMWKGLADEQREVVVKVMKSLGKGDYRFRK